MLASVSRGLGAAFGWPTPMDFVTAIFTKLSLLVYAVPLAFVALKVLKIPLRAWLPYLIPVAILLFIGMIDDLLGPEFWGALIYLLAGFR